MNNGNLAFCFVFFFQCRIVNKSVWFGYFALGLLKGDLVLSPEL